MPVDLGTGTDRFSLGIELNVFNLEKKYPLNPIHWKVLPYYGMYFGI